MASAMKVAQHASRPKNTARQQTRLLNQQKSDDLSNTQPFKTVLSSQRQWLTAWQVDRHSRRQLGQVALASVLHKHLADWANIAFLFPSTLHPLAQESVARKQMAITWRQMCSFATVCPCVHWWAPTQGLSSASCWRSCTVEQPPNRLRYVPKQRSHQLPWCVWGSPKTVTNNIQSQGRSGSCHRCSLLMRWDDEGWLPQKLCNCWLCQNAYLKKHSATYLITNLETISEFI